MADILFDELKPILNYFPIKVGKAEIFFRTNNIGLKTFQLCYDGLQWCTLNIDNPLNYVELKEFLFDINLTYGKVVTTGLGFGLLQTVLCQKSNVSEVIVYEKHEEIIEMFLTFVKQSNFNISKLKIINKDAKQSVEEDCDWLCMDHFECVHQTLWEVIDEVRELSLKSKAKNVMFWPIHQAYLEFCKKKNLPFNQNSYSQFENLIKIDKLPKQIDELILQKVNYFLDIEEQRRKRMVVSLLENEKNNK